LIEVLERRLSADTDVVDESLCDVEIDECSGAARIGAQPLREQVGAH
jgi:hypothetical protein